MKNKRVTFGESVEYFDVTTGQRKWRKAHIEYDIDDSDDFRKELDNASEIVGGWFKSEKPEEKKEQKPMTSEEIMIASIKSSKTLQTLKWSEPRGDNALNPRIMEAYNNKLKEFQ